MNIDRKDLRVWLLEREHNALVIANRKSVADSEMWREDAAHFKAAYTALDELDKSERMRIEFSDIISNHCIAMQAAVIDAEFQSPEHGMKWIANTLCGPGLLPNMTEARTMPKAVLQSVAQAWFDAKTAEHEAFRAAHPGPAKK